MSDLHLVKPPNEDEAKKQEQAKRTELVKPEDGTLARQYVKATEGKLAYFHSDWHAYENGFWKVTSVEKINLSVMHFLEKYPRRGFRVTTSLTKRITEAVQWIIKLEDEEIDRKMSEGRHYINLRNGLYNLETHQLEAHQPGFYFTYQLGFAYDEDAPYDLWLNQFLKKSLVLPDSTTPDQRMIELLQEAFGYCMTPYTDLKAMFWLRGVPDSGKSTAISVLETLLGQLCAPLNLNTLGSDKYATSVLVGKWVITCTEADTNHILPDGLIKTVVGGVDSIQVERKYKDSYRIKPTAKLLWGMNQEPRTNDRSGAVVNRLRVILFNRTIPENERIGGFADKLIPELAGIFNWAMVGYRRLRRAGRFTIPKQSQVFLEDYRLKNDTEKTFIMEETEQHPDYSENGQRLYDSYNYWCKQNGFFPKNRNQFADDLRRLGFNKEHTRTGSIWHGVRLKTKTPFL